MNRYTIFVFCFFTYVYSYAQNRIVIDSLQRKLLHVKSDTTKINLYNALGWEYRNSDYKLADSLADLSILLAKKIEFEKGVGNAYLIKAIALRTQGSFEQAIKTARWALVHFVKDNFRPGFSSVYNFIASVHFIQGNHKPALYYYLQSLKVSEELNDVQGIAKSLNNVGAVYLEQKLYDKALLYFNRSYKIIEKVGDENSKAACLNNIGNIYQYKEEYDSAIAKYSISAEINLKIGDKRDASAALHNIGLVYFEQGLFKQALNSFLQSLLIDEKLGDINAIIITYGNIADCYTKLEMFHAALKYAKESFIMAKAFNMKKDIMNAYNMLSKIEEKNGHYKEALINHQLYKVYSDSIYNLENTEQIASLEEQYLHEKQEKLNVLASTESEIDLFKTQEKEREVTKYIFIIGLVLIIFVTLIYVVFFLVLRRPKTS